MAVRGRTGHFLQLVLPFWTHTTTTTSESGETETTQCRMYEGVLAAAKAAYPLMNAENVCLLAKLTHQFQIDTVQCHLFVEPNDLVAGTLWDAVVDGEVCYKMLRNLFTHARHIINRMSPHTLITCCFIALLHFAVICTCYRNNRVMLRNITRNTPAMYLPCYLPPRPCFQYISRVLF